MTKRRETDNTRPDLFPAEEFVAHSYRETTQDVPPAVLDTKILAEARREVETMRKPSRLTTRWVIPVSVAAVVVLSLGVVLQISQRPAPDYDESLPSRVAGAPVRKEAAPPTAHRDTPVPTEAKPVAPPAASPSNKRESTAPLAAKSPAASSAMQAEPPEQDARSAVPRSKAAADALKKFSVGMAAQEMQRAINDKADVVSVRVNGQPGAYQFEVGVRSPDTGCQQYADWWEVISADGRLLYRHVLPHSHIGEQPFVRTGGPVTIQPDTEVWVRAHMNNSGYGGGALKGSVAKGFSTAPLGPNASAELARQKPLPPGCDF